MTFWTIALGSGVTKFSVFNLMGIISYLCILYISIYKVIIACLNIYEKSDNIYKKQSYNA